MKLYRQGDVLIRRIDAMPVGEKRQRSDGILAHGEATGHSHRTADLTAADLFDCGDGMFLVVGDHGVSIVHDEHDPIKLPAGNYQIIRQREYSPEAIRNVAD